MRAFCGWRGGRLAVIAGWSSISSLILNDADRRIYAFWHSALKNPERFCARINDVPLTIDEWRHQRAICTNPDSYDAFDVGFAAFFMNRCNRSGVLSAGPIGGKSQQGRWRMDARFNRNGLIRRISALKKFKEKIRLSNLPAVKFLKRLLDDTNKSMFVYLDPPYITKARRLYSCAYDDRGHAMLATYMIAHAMHP